MTQAELDLVAWEDAILEEAVCHERQPSNCGRMIGPYALEFWIRFYAKIAPVTDECWKWIGAKGDHGYGIIMNGRKALLAHRVSVEMDNRSIPAGFEVDHLCKVRCCVNPAHLEVVSQAENNRRSDSFSAVHMRKTCCPKCGNAYTLRDKAGSRRCIPCRLKRARERCAIAGRNPQKI